MGDVSKEQLLEMMKMMQSMIENISDEEPVDEVVEKPKQKAKKKRISKKPKNRIQAKGVIVPDRPNLFDEMPERNMHKSDTAIDKKLSQHPPTPRSRKFSTIGVVCRICGKKENMAPSLVPEDVSRYKCNKCCGSQG